MEQSMHQTPLTMPQHHQTQTTIHPSAMHMSTAAAAAAAAAGLPPGTAATGPTGPQTHHHFLSSPALASPVGSTNNPTHNANPPIAANAPCSTLFVANLGQFVSEHELKEVFSRGAGLESRHDLYSKKAERELSTHHHHHALNHHHQQHQQFLMTTPT